MKLLNIKTEVLNGFIKLSALVERECPKEKFEIYFQYPKQFETFLCKNADPFIPALLIPCMLKGEQLTICPSISHRLLRNITTIQDILTRWYPRDLSRVEVNALQIVKDPHIIGKNVGAFFSLGVDSFYTLFKNIHELPLLASPITHLIFMNGIELPLTPKSDIERTYFKILEVANKTKKECIYGETNIRIIFPVSYERYYSGPCLASVALSLSGGMGSVLIPSHSPYDDLDPSGTHILLDHLWSTENIEIIHDGCELNRSEKIEKIVKLEPMVLDYLRTCTSNKGQEWNCGKCIKCIRTMVSLKAIDFLRKSKTYPHDIPKKSIKKLFLKNKERELSFTEANLKLARKANKDKKLIKELDVAIHVFKRKKAAKMFLKEFPMFFNFLKRIKKPLSGWVINDSR